MTLWCCENCNSLHLLYDVEFPYSSETSWASQSKWSGGGKEEPDEAQARTARFLLIAHQHQPASGLRLCFHPLVVFAIVNTKTKMFFWLVDWQIQFRLLKLPSLLARGPKQSIPPLLLAFYPSSLLLSPLASELISPVVELSLWVRAPFPFMLQEMRLSFCMRMWIKTGIANPSCARWILQISAGADQVRRLRLVQIKASEPQTWRPATNYFTL